MADVISRPETHVLHHRVTPVTDCHQGEWYLKCNGAFALCKDPGKTYLPPPFLPQKGIPI